MNRQRNRKRLFSSILCLSLALSGLTVPAGKVQAEDINEEKETEYASEPVEIYPWEAPTVKTMDFGTGNMIDPARPNNSKDAWKGCFVYYGSYDDKPVKYRVLDASTTDYSADGKTQTMLLDCDSILCDWKFDEDLEANVTGKKANDWSISDVKTSLNGTDFLDNEDVFTSVEKSAIAQSTKAGHALTTDSKTGVNVSGGTQGAFVNYIALDGEQIFLLDAEDVSNGAYGYSMAKEPAENRKKTGGSDNCWWLRSASIMEDFIVGFIYFDGDIYELGVDGNVPSVSPALNVKLSSVLFSSASISETGFAGKSSALNSESTAIGTTQDVVWKLTLKDEGKAVTLTEGRSVTKAGDGTITVPYTYTDGATADKEKVNQISVMITDKAYDAAKEADAQEAQILYYGALENIRNDRGEASTVAQAATGTGTFSIPSGLTGTMGEDYHVYLLAEHMNMDNSTDYASEPFEVEVKTPVDRTEVEVPSIEAPIAELPFAATEVSISGTNLLSKAMITWSKDGKTVSGNAELNTTYTASVTLTAADGYALIDASGVAADVILNGKTVDSSDITANADGTITVILGDYTSVKRKLIEVTAPAVPVEFANYYTAENVLSARELSVPAKVTLEGITKPEIVDMEVEWLLANADPYDSTPGAANTFQWVLKESAYADYDKNNVVIDGTVTIQNKDYTPVSISGPDVEITYDGSHTLDVSKYFTIDANAGAPTYELLGTSTGTGTLNDTTLTMHTLGTFAIRVSTAMNGVYQEGEHTLTITVNKAAAPANKPESAINTIYTNDTVETVTLPEDWIWKTEDKTKALEVGKAVTATAIYNGADKGNYVTESVEISITRQVCTHIWDNGVVTKEPTTSEKGEKTYTCSVCKAVRTEEIPVKEGTPAKDETPAKDATQAKDETPTKDETSKEKTLPAVGTKLTSDDGKATYKITRSSLKNGTVTYAATTNKKASTIVIPDTVVVSGVTYQVTAVEKNAFANNKKLKTVTIGKNVTAIGAKAFYGCKNIKTLIIKSKKLTTKKIGSKAFSKTPKKMTVKVPKNKFKAYKKMLIKRGVDKKVKFKKF